MASLELEKIKKEYRDLRLGLTEAEIDEVARTELSMKVQHDLEWTAKRKKLRDKTALESKKAKDDDVTASAIFDDVLSSGPVIQTAPLKKRGRRGRDFVIYPHGSKAVPVPEKPEGTESIVLSVTDHKGNVFPSKTACFKFYGWSIHDTTIQKLTAKGKTTAQICRFMEKRTKALHDRIDKERGHG